MKEESNTIEIESERESERERERESKKEGEKKKGSRERKPILFTILNIKCFYYKMDRKQKKIYKK